MGRKKKPDTKDDQKKAPKEKAETADAPRATGMFHSPEFKCRKARNEDKYYCYQRVQGRWEENQGPFDTLEECLECTGGSA